MPRKQNRQGSRKRLWFNVVEFDKETGRPLWRNKKSRLENDIPSCITDPTFTAMLDKLREETELALNMHSPQSNSPCSTVWRNNSKAYRPVETTKPHYCRSASYEDERGENSPKLIMQFQHFSPLTTEDLDSSQQKRHIQDFLKMKPLQYGGSFGQGYPTDCGSKCGRCFSGSEAFVPDSADVLANDWDNTVRLHHLDYDNKNSVYANGCDFNTDQKVPLAIF